jgi:hypothetical protein
VIALANHGGAAVLIGYAEQPDGTCGSGREWGHRETLTAGDSGGDFDNQYLKNE